MKKCPYCAEEIQDEAIYCRYCQKDLSPAKQSWDSGVPAYAQKQTVWALEPLKKYAVFSGRARRKEYWSFQVAAFSVVFLMTLFETYVVQETQMTFTFLLILFLFIPIYSVSVRRLHDIGESGWMIFVNVIPIIGGVIFLVMTLTNSQDGTNKYGPNPKSMQATNHPVQPKQRNKYTIPLITITVVLIFLYFTGDYFLAAFSPTPVPTRTPRSTYTPRPTPIYTPTYISPYLPSQPDCLRWDQVTLQMVDQTHCVYGVVHSLNQSNKTWTRYQFSDQPNTFFAYSQNYEYYDPKTGKTLGVGTCIFITGEIERIQNVTFINLEKTTDFKFSTSPNDCQ